MIMNSLKKLLIRLGIAFAAVGIFIGGITIFFQQTKTVVSAVSVDEAKSIAVKNAGARFADATFTRVEKEFNDGRDVYDVEFYTEEGDFDYVIDAETGKVVERDTKMYAKNQTTTQSITQAPQNTTVATPQTSEAQAIQSVSPTPAQPVQAPVSPVSPQGTISQDEAINIALSNAGTNRGSVTGLYAYLDTDDGYPQYEVEFSNPSSAIDYDYTIDASTGYIVERSQDSLLDD